ncbi:hypothetical protein J2Y55_003079 [Bosea sp. BE125]|uniref:nucleotide kinase domain-containing protein n=1 Tax=Bosea sp. BE125 TaxID=2817909 RepID=UPI00285B1853|nr:nucleotide kinase domain-containing protein [Bosea sp. BE125]MDR6872063.1 hypothetical protein [Bosea sp. BE125]
MSEKHRALVRSGAQESEDKHISHAIPHLSSLPTPTAVYDTFWRFAAERLAMYYRRLIQPTGPWSADGILNSYRFTNTYRVTDRVSQYLIREVQYGKDRSQEPQEVFFRTLLFKTFNKIETWERLEAVHGSMVWRTAKLADFDKTLDMEMARGRTIYSAAYIMPAPPFGQRRKHSNHLYLIAKMMDDRLPDRLRQAPDLGSVYETIRRYPGLGPFLAFQYAIDLNYSSLIDFDEDSFVVAGPGALDGIAKCFGVAAARTPEAIIHLVTERQEQELASRGLEFPGLFGRRLQPIDVQNLFCEISKYARVAHPDVIGTSGRQRIKQSFIPAARPVPPALFPPSWKLDPSVLPLAVESVAPATHSPHDLFAVGMARRGHSFSKGR